MSRQTWPGVTLQSPAGSTFLDSKSDPDVGNLAHRDLDRGDFCNSQHTKGPRLSPSLSILHNLEALPVLSWAPPSLSLDWGKSPFLLREQLVTPCLRNWWRSQLDLVEKKASHFWQGKGFWPEQEKNIYLSGFLMKWKVKVAFDLLSWDYRHLFPPPPLPYKKINKLH